MLPLVVRIDADDKRSADQLRRDGWREIEILQTYRSDIRPESPTYIRRATIRDLAVCIDIAMRVRWKSRLHVDDEVREEDADKFKLDWINHAFHDHYSKIFVTPEKGEPEALIILKGNRIDLLGVCHQKEGRGHGLRLVRHAQHLCGELYAGTQATNHGAMRLYQRAGMKLVKRERTFHKCLP